MKQHEPCAANEIFVGNTTTKEGIRPHLKELKTVRLGSVAYDIDGKKIPKDQCLPVFISREELEKHDQIMMARLRAASGTPV